MHIAVRTWYTQGSLHNVVKIGLHRLTEPSFTCNTNTNTNDKCMHVI